MLNPKPWISPLRPGQDVPLNVTCLQRAATISVEDSWMYEVRCCEPSRQEDALADVFNFVPLNPCLPCAFNPVTFTGTPTT